MRSRNSILLLLLVLLLLCCGAAYLLLGGDGDRDASPTAPDGDSAAGRPGDLPPGTGTGDGPGESGDPSSGGDEAGETGEGEEEFSFEKETPWSVSVRVLDREDEPVESKVEILDPRVEWSFGELPRKGKGAFAGFLPEPGHYAAEAVREGTRLRVAFEITEAKPAAEVEIRYAGTGVISGALFSTLGSLEDGVKGKYKVLGQEDLTVDLVADGSRAEARLSCRVLASGEYRIDSVPPGDYMLRVKNKFYAARLRVAENEHVVHDILLGAGRIAGRVTDRATGDPLQTVQVVIQLSVPQSGKADLLRQAGFLSVSDRLVPDENGHYAFTNLPTGEYRLFSNGRDHAPLRKTATISEDAPDVKLDFPLERGSSVDISVFDLEGNPIENPLWITQGIRCGFVGHVTGLRVGKHEFIAFAPGHEIQIREDVEFLPGKPTKLEFRLAKEAATRLVFRDPEGEPVEGVRVSVWVKGHDLQPLLESFFREQRLTFRVTGPDGAIAIRGVRAGPVRVLAKKSGFARFDEQVTLAAAKKEIAVALEPAETEFVWRLRIARVNPGGQADRLGLEPGDVLLAYEGVEIHSQKALTGAIESAKQKGLAAANLAVERDGKRFEVKVTPGVLGVRLLEFED